MERRPTFALQKQSNRWRIMNRRDRSIYDLDGGPFDLGGYIQKAHAEIYCYFLKRFVKVHRRAPSSTKEILTFLQEKLRTTDWLGSAVIEGEVNVRLASLANATPSLTTPSKGEVAKPARNASEPIVERKRVSSGK